ncbi:WD40-repeat-containing domain protein [Mucidula mucida]|nr:WD40-repeat-containing domain protein [Mucidula mucida]
MWFRDSSASPPYKVAGKMPAHKSWRGKCYDAVAFPWTRASLDDLWHSHSKDVVDPSYWHTLISDFEDAVILVGKNSARMIHTRDFTKAMICLEIPEAPAADHTVLSTDHVQATWVLNPGEEPDLYIVLAYARLIYICDAYTGKVVTHLRGHGGSITSLNTHPIYPQIFCSTSRDFTTRIYRLDREPKQKPKNPPWPPSRRPSMAGPAHGLDMTEGEGFPKKGGLGRCICVLVGGQAGGHNGDVLNAEFHPKLPLIVTCGTDRVIKIWYVPNALKLTGDRLLREDKPLFSSSRIHKARVHSVSWLPCDDASDDEILISYSAPAFMRRFTAGQNPETDPAENYMKAGTVCLWKWLARKRFFPYDHSKQDVLRGCPSDYQECSAFQFLSIYELSHATENLAPARMSLFRSPRHDPWFW